MKITWMIIVGIIMFILSMKHIIQRPDFEIMNDAQTMLWFHQLWYYNSMTLFLFIADTFYSKLGD